MATKHAGTRITIIIISVLLCASLALYEYILPERNARAYLSTLRANARQTKVTFQKLAATFDDLESISSDTSPEKRRAAATTIQHAITDARASLATIDKANSGLHPYPLSGYIGSYKLACVTQQHATDFVTRSNTTLTTYDASVTQLLAYVSLLDRAQVIFDNFNAVVDINSYAGQSDAVRSNAAELQNSSAALQSMKLPTEYDASRSAAIDALTEGIAGYNHLADALDNPADDAIYGAAHEIEAAGTALEASNQSSLGAQLSSTRLVKDIGDLVETVDYLES